MEWTVEQIKEIINNKQIKSFNENSIDRLGHNLLSATATQSPKDLLHIIKNSNIDCSLKIQNKRDSIHLFFDQHENIEDEKSLQYKIDILKEAIKSGYDINNLNEYNENLLQVIFKNESEDNLGLTQFLLNNDINVNNNSINDENSLFYAVENKMKHNNQILEMILPYIQDINQKNFEGQNVLMRACRNTPTAIEIIMKNQPDINIQNKTGETASMITCLFCPEKLNIVLKNANLNHFNIENSDGENLFDVSEYYEEPAQSIVKSCWENIKLKHNSSKKNNNTKMKIL